MQAKGREVRQDGLGCQAVVFGEDFGGWVFCNILCHEFHNFYMDLS